MRGNNNNRKPHTLSFEEGHLSHQISVRLPLLDLGPHVPIKLTLSLSLSLCSVC